VSQRSL
jgi:hypothetical protein